MILGEGVCKATEFENPSEFSWPMSVDSLAVDRARLVKRHNVRGKREGSYDVSIMTKAVSSKASRSRRRIEAFTVVNIVGPIDLAKQRNLKQVWNSALWTRTDPRCDGDR